jgi:hypothetical protein
MFIDKRTLSNWCANRAHFILPASEIDFIRQTIFHSLSGSFFLSFHVGTYHPTVRKKYPALDCLRALLRSPVSSQREL